MFRRRPTRCTDGVVGLLVAVVLVTTAACGTRSRDVAEGARALVVAAAPTTVPPATTSSTTASSTSSSTATSTSTTLVTATSTTVAATAATPVTAPPQPAPAPPPQTVSVSGAYCVGDSVMLAAGPALFDELTVCQVVDAVESRQVRNAAPATSQAAASGASVVVVHLGTNGPFRTAQLDAALAPLAGVPRVVLVTIQTSGRSYQATVNAELRAAPSRHPNVRIADFEAASAGQPHLFASDGIHLLRSGSQLLNQVIAGAAA